MSDIIQHVKADKVKWVIVTIAIILLTVAVIGIVVGITRDFGKDINFKVGTLNATGQYAESNSSIYMKDSVSCKNLTVEKDFEAQITYRIVFYDGNEKFLGSTEELSGNFSTNNNEEFTGEGKFATAKYFRIVITPTADEEIVGSEVLTYAGQLTIKHK